MTFFLSVIKKIFVGKYFGIYINGILLVYV